MKTKDDTDQSGNLFILSWDNLGLEACIPVTEKIAGDLFNTIKTGKSTVMQELNHTLSMMMMMRARVNSQRHYEIYSVTVDKDIDKEQMVEMFNENPQGMADLIRDRGTKLYSDRMEVNKCVIV